MVPTASAMMFIRLPKALPDFSGVLLCTPLSVGPAYFICGPRSRLMPVLPPWLRGPAGQAEILWSAKQLIVKARLSAVMIFHGGIID